MPLAAIVENRFRDQRDYHKMTWAILTSFADCSVTLGRMIRQSGSRSRERSMLMLCEQNPSESRTR